MRFTTDTPVLVSTPARPLARFWPANTGRVRGDSVPTAVRPSHDRAGAPEPVSNADVSQRFGTKLRSLRSARNMTQQDMARRFGIDRSFISDVERGRKSVSLVTLEVLALGMGVSISELLSDV